MMDALSRYMVGMLVMTVLLVPVAGQGAESWTRLTDGLPSPQVEFVKRYGDAVWVGTLGGLVKYQGGELATVFSGAAIWEMVPMGDGRYWIGTDKGILVLDGSTTSRSLGEDYSVGRLVALGAAGAWAIADRRDQTSLLAYREGTWQPVPFFADRAVEDLFTDSQGRVWVLLDADGLVAADPAADASAWVHHLEGINVRAFLEDRKGRIWCGTWGRGIRVMDGDTWKRELPKETAVITTIVEDGTGHIWAATNANGLWQFDGERWINHLRDEGTINVLAAPGDGRVYVSSQFVPALRTWTGTAWKTLVEVPAIFRGVAQGPDGKLLAGNTVLGLYLQP